VATDGAPPTRGAASASASACEPHREYIEEKLALGRCAKLIWQDLVERHGFQHRYASVMRFARKLRPQSDGRQACAVIETAPGEEGQVDYAGDGPLVRHERTGKYRRTRLFSMTLGYSRKSRRFVAWKSSSAMWVELHERAFRAFGKAPRLIVLDNLREGVLKPEIYDPTLNPLYRAMLAHYGVAALTCRVNDPDRKGKVEADIKAAERAHRGLRFESIEEAQVYYDQRAERWDDTRIHGTTKQQVRERFDEEYAAMLPLPVEPFRHFRYGKRTVHPDGHIEVEGAYYCAPPGMIHQRVHVQWDEKQVRILTTRDVLLREYRRSEKRGRHVNTPEDRPRYVPGSTQALLAAATTVGAEIGEVCALIHRRDGQEGVRRIQGILALAKKHGVARVQDAARAALECGAPSYRFVKNWLERTAAPALSLRQVDALIRPLTEYRDLIERMSRSPSQGETP
jgi:transposase